MVAEAKAKSRGGGSSRAPSLPGVDWTPLNDGGGGSGGETWQATALSQGRPLVMRTSEQFYGTLERCVRDRAGRGRGSTLMGWFLVVTVRRSCVELPSLNFGRVLSGWFLMNQSTLHLLKGFCIDLCRGGGGGYCDVIGFFRLLPRCLWHRAGRVLTCLRPCARSSNSQHHRLPS